MIEGIVEKVGSQARGAHGNLAYSVLLDGAWYGHGFKQPGFSQGDKVSFEVDTVTKGDKQYFNIKHDSVEVKQTGAAPALTRDASGISAVDMRTVLHASRAAAVDVADLLLTHNGVKIPKADGKNYEPIKQLVNDLTVEYYQQGMSIMKGDWPFDEDAAPPTGDSDDG